MSDLVKKVRKAQDKGKIVVLYDGDNDAYFASDKDAVAVFEVADGDEGMKRDLGGNKVFERFLAGVEAAGNGEDE